jgi:ribosomal protein S17E
MWAYRFIARLPEHMKLAPVKQRTKESKRIQAEDAGFLAHWYDQLKQLLYRVPSRLVYNFDECGFQPGQGRSRNVIGSKSSCPDLTEAERGETITAVECIGADGWLMDPLFIFKSSGSNFMESWYDGSEALPPNTGTALSPNGWISDELALAWLDYFITTTGTDDRLKPGEKRYLIFDGHGAHLTLEFIQKCEDNAIVPFAFLPHSTHLCQPLDGKPFLNYKQQFRLMNNELSFWGGQPYGKSDFLRIIAPIRARTFNPRSIRQSFKDRGIWPVNGSKIVADLTNQLEIPDLYAPDLRSFGSSTPSPPPPNLSSSSVENSPPATIEALNKNQAKIIKDINTLSDKTQRNLTKVFEHQRQKLEELAMTQDAIQRIRAAQAPQRRLYTKRQVKPLSQDGILKPRDANRSIRERREKEKAAEKRKLDKDIEKVYGIKPTRRTKESLQRAIDNEKEARENGELFFEDY